MTSPDPAAILAQINSAREQTYQNIATAQGILDQANAAASAAAQDRAAIQAIAQQTVRVDTSVGTRVFAGDVMIYGDTGSRNVENLFVNGWRKYVYPTKLRRIGNRCFLNAYLDKGTATSTKFMDPIAGYSIPVQTQFGGSVMGSITNTAEVVKAFTDGFYIPRYANIQPQMWVDISWLTDDPWPTSLPGTPA